MVAMLWGSVAPPAYACTCVTPPLEEQVTRAELIFVGRVATVEYDPPLNDPPRNAYDIHNAFVILQVERYIKGSGGSYVRMRDPGYVVDAVLNGKPTRFQSLGCSVFEIEPTGKRFLVFTRSVQQPILADYCSGSMELRDYRPEAGAYLASVERILAPDAVPSGGGPPSSSDDVALPAAAGALGSLVFLAGAAFLWRRGG
jgi:hypothetical protein